MKNVMGNKAKIDHIEFWVSNLSRSLKWYSELFSIIGWKRISKNAFSNGETTIYFIEQNVRSRKTAGPRHICFTASSRNMVDRVGKFLKTNKNTIVRGPIDSIWKSFHSYTVDFKDPNGYVIEVTAESKTKRK